MVSIEEIIKELKFQIQLDEEENEEPDVKSWQFEKGVLITREYAEEIIAYLTSSIEQNEEIRKRGL